MRFVWLLFAFVSTTAFAQDPSAERNDGPPAVDVELVIADDVSHSMTKDELALRREAYAQAIVSKEFIDALKSGLTGRVSVTYFEWSARNYQNVIVRWRVIDGPEAAAAVAV